MGAPPFDPFDVVFSLPATYGIRITILGERSGHSGSTPGSCVFAAIYGLQILSGGRSRDSQIALLPSL